MAETGQGGVLLVNIMGLGEINKDSMASSSVSLQLAVSVGSPSESLPLPPSSCHSEGEKPQGGERLGRLAGALKCTVGLLGSLLSLR